MPFNNLCATNKPSNLVNKHVFQVYYEEAILNKLYDIIEPREQGELG